MILSLHGLGADVRQALTNVAVAIHALLLDLWSHRYILELFEYKLGQQSLALVRHGSLALASSHTVQGQGSLLWFLISGGGGINFS